MDELRFRSQQSPRNEAQMNAFVSPPRNGNRLPQPVSHDPRSTLPRRFTTDSGRVPTLSSLTAQRNPEPQDISTNAAVHKQHLFEKKKLEYERVREQKRRFAAEMHKLDQQERREELELAAMQEDIRISAFTGHQSEPTTPPEYRETSSGFPTMFSRPNRYSTSSLTLASPPGIFNRPGRSGSQLVSPQSGMMLARYAFDDQLPSRSVPGSRRNSDEDEKEEAVRQDPTSHRSTNALNRYSMPVTRSRTGFYDLNLDQNNTTRFLFGEDEDGTLDNDHKHFQPTKPDDAFSGMNRRDGQPNILSAFPAALDLASQAPVEADSWPTSNRHRSQHSMSTLTSPTSATMNGGQVQVTTAQQAGMTDVPTMNSTLRHSFDLKGKAKTQAFAESNLDAGASFMAAAVNPGLVTPPKLQSSFSTNDIPTVKNSGGTLANNHAETYLQNHNMSLGRIPAGAIRHNRELSSENNTAANREAAVYSSIGSTLHANAPAFGPVPATHQQIGGVQNGNQMTPSPYANYAPYYNAASMAGAPLNMTSMAAPNMNGAGTPYAGANGNQNPYPVNVPLLSQGMQAMNIGNGSGYSPQNYTGYGSIYPNQNHVRDSQARVIRDRRQVDNEAMNRYTNLPLEAVGGTIYELCKDQHGCRYLQRQLENRIPEQVHMIWVETSPHVVELMTDPFGNYLCQKLLEYCNDEERTVLIQNAAQDMVRIALNQHGTRALQKMIEHISSAQQITIIIEALRHRVVELIQDLNGNHVIQKCLNKLDARDSQFIFDAVGGACVEVGTHRHGCCVLQRCIDHASGDQKLWLIQRITEHAVTLIQDPFGNYVVQYIIDLNDPNFTEPLVLQFAGRICALSKHKFSSNVIEKCLRCCQDASKDVIVSELLQPNEINQLLRDSFANYVIQTALEYATPFMKHNLVEAIRPILPQIRATPYGRRIQGKVQAYDARSGPNSGQVTPHDASHGQIPLRPAHARAMSNNTSILTPGAYSMGDQNGMNNYPMSHILGVPPPVPEQSQILPGVNGVPRFGVPTQVGAQLPGHQIGTQMMAQNAGMTAPASFMANGSGPVNGAVGAGAQAPASINGFNHGINGNPTNVGAATNGSPLAQTNGEKANEGTATWQ